MPELEDGEDWLDAVNSAAAGPDEDEDEAMPWDEMSDWPLEDEEDGEC